MLRLEACVTHVPLAPSLCLSHESVGTSFRNFQFRLFNHDEASALAL